MPLTDFVERLRTSKPESAVPYFDPTEAGVEALILLLLEAPGRRSALEAGSGFVSSDDQTAQNMWHLLRDAGIDRARDVVTWNVVPWYIGDGTKIRRLDPPTSMRYVRRRRDSFRCCRTFG